MNSTATAWNSALPVRPMLAPSGSTKLATVREIRRSLSAASSMTGSVASDEVVENAMTREARMRSEEHTSELQSPYDLVCRLLLEKKKKIGRLTLRMIKKDGRGGDEG